MRYDAVVVGAGIFGSLITRALRRAGLETLTIDSREPDAGSPPAACLMRPSWFSSVGKGVYEPALQKLDELVGVWDLDFKVSIGRATIHWCDPQRVLLGKQEFRVGKVFRILPESGQWVVSFSTVDLQPELVTARLLVIAAGIWTPTLWPEVSVVGQAGIAWLWSKGKIEQPFVNVWAPYKQLVAFNRGDGLWIGDGTSVRNWSDKYLRASRERCVKELSKREDVLGIAASPRPLFGYRPYVIDAKPCYLKQVKPGLWVATGGAKNGTLAAGWCADQITRAVV